MKRNKPNASSSKGRKDVEGRDHDPCCAVCMSDEFYEDEQGGMICVACGTQSQDFLAEGFDEDDLAVYGGGMGNIVTLKNASGKGMKAVEETKIRKVTLVPDVLEALKLYQFVLQMIFDACLNASNASISNLSEAEVLAMNATYRSTLKSVWLDYLNGWNTDQQYQPPPPADSRNDKRARFKASAKCSLGAGFTRASKYQCKCRDVGNINTHPLFPSKPLLLGFVYLTYRIMRSDVLIADIVRWCESGVVPYANLWENIPQRWRDSVKVDMRWFYDTGSKKVYVTPSTVLFHACSIAQVIRVEPTSAINSTINTNSSTKYSAYDTEMPPLNAPLVAHKLHSTLGLPPIVWELYTKITQMFTSGVPINGAHVLEQHHELHIMAALVVAVKFSPRWTEWVFANNTSRNSISEKSTSSSAGGMYTPYKSTTSTTTTHSTTNVSMPETTADVNALTRAQLPLLLSQIRRVNQLHTLHTETHKTKFLYNNAVFAALGGDLEKANKGEGQFATEDTYGSQPHTTPFNTAHNTTPYKTPRSSHNTPHTPHTPYTTYNTPYTPHRSLHTAEVPLWSATNTTDTTLRMSSVVCGECMVTEDLPIKDMRKLNYMNGIEPYQNTNTSNTTHPKKHNKLRKQVTFANNEKSVYMAYTRYDTDRTSLHHLPYIVLLERCAKYLYVNPQLLHELVTNMEKQIVSLAFTGATSSASTTTTSTTLCTAKADKKRKYNAVDHLSDTDNVKQRLISAKERDMHNYRLKSDKILPTLHTYGINGTSVNVADFEYSVAGRRGGSALNKISTKKGVVVKIEGTHYDSNTQYTLHTADTDDNSVNSLNSVDSAHDTTHNTKNTENTNTSTKSVQYPFIFHPSTDCADIDDVFGADNVLHRVDIKHKRKRTKKDSTDTSPDTNTATNTITNTTTDPTNTTEPHTPKTSHYTDYTTNTSGADSDVQRNSPHSQRNSPQHAEFDLLHNYTTTQAGQVTPPISELTYSRTPFSAFNTTKGVSLVERSVRSVGNTSRNKHGAAMEALDRLVSAQDSDSESIQGSDSSDSSIVVDESGGEDEAPPLTQPRARNTKTRTNAATNGNNGVSSYHYSGSGSASSNHIFGNLGRTNNTSHNSSGRSTFNLSSTPVVPLPLPLPINSTPLATTNSNGGLSMLARAIYGTPANNQPTTISTSASVLNSALGSAIRNSANGVMSNINSTSQRPVVSLKRPRHSVQFEKK